MKFNNKNKLQLPLYIKLRIKTLNKFSATVFILLLSCGAALWFLASDSLNFHIKNQLTNIGSELTQQNVTVDDVTIRSYQGSGTITNLVIKNQSSNGILNIKYPALSFSSIDLFINRDSLKDEVIIIESITFHGLNALIHYKEMDSNLEKLLTRVHKNARLFKAKENSIEQNKQPISTPRLLTVSKVIIKPGILEITSDKGENVSFETSTKIELQNIGDKAGSTGEAIGVAILDKLLIELDIQADYLQNKVTNTL